jgi:hypothetical protein
MLTCAHCVMTGISSVDLPILLTIRKLHLRPMSLQPPSHAPARVRNICSIICPREALVRNEIVS